MFVQSYVYFDGRCEEAIKFYSRQFGAETTFLMRSMSALTRKRKRVARRVRKTR